MSDSRITIVVPGTVDSIEKVGGLLLFQVCGVGGSHQLITHRAISPTLSPGLTQSPALWAVLTSGICLPSGSPH